jgi:hypothetical protein
VIKCEQEKIITSLKEELALCEQIKTETIEKLNKELETLQSAKKQEAENLRRT